MFFCVQLFFSNTSTMEAEFRKAADEVQRLNKKPNNSDLLTLYGLYKQSTEGDCNTSL